MLITALQMRWRRAQKIAAGDVRRNPAKPSQFFVRSQSHGNGGYLVELHFTRESKLKSATCTCPDFSKEVHDLAKPMLRDVRVCKHILAAAREAKNA